MQARRASTTGWEAVRQGDWDEAVRLLDERGERADPTDLDKPLFWAAGRGRSAIVDLLLARGANIDAKYSGGWTPLMHAAEQGQQKVTELLLRRGADVTARNFGNHTAERRASQPEIRKMIQVGPFATCLHALIAPWPCQACSS
jgi:ankyrin repeat protein